MYTSIKAHFENGQVVFDEPVNAVNGSDLIVTFLSQLQQPEKNKNSLLREALLKFPTISEEEYQVFIDQKKDWANSRLSK